ncbi:Arr3 protein [Saccharomycopsis crataegensis]|uniref:Arr3 protein n=1 Tax=Saccharomycopsis crataegensis TaxID=43959 RepID=A0AAV5QR98_9ASCO|nr:Arr3 protein [Saccharomycopsis crataegensis]
MKIVMDSANNKIFYRLIKELSWTDRLLPVIIILSIVLGTLISVYDPSARNAFDSQHRLAGVSAPLAVGLIIMMIPPLCKVEWENIHNILRQKRIYTQLVISLILNWIVCPLLMVALAWMALFNDEEYRTGIIMIGVARCIAMVLVWNELAGGDNTLCIIIVVMNSILQMLLYAPYQIFLCYIISNTPRSGSSVSYQLVAKSVGVFLGIPFGFGLLIRLGSLCIFGKKIYEKKLLPLISPWSLIGLVYTIIVIFIARGDDFIKNIGQAFKCFIPLTVYFVITWFGTLFFMRYFSNYVNRKKIQAVGEEEPLIRCGCEKTMERESAENKWKMWCGAKYGETITQTFTAASNNFELSLSIAISIYGSGSKQSIAATFGPLLEVPILLFLTVVAKYFQLKLLWNDDEIANDKIDSSNVEGNKIDLCQSAK